MSDGQTGPRPPEAGGPHLEQGRGSQGRCGGRDRFSPKLWTTGPAVRSPGTEEPHDSGTPDPRHRWPLGRQPRPANRPQRPPQRPPPIRPRLPLIPTPTLRWRLCALLSGWLWGSLLSPKGRLPQPPWTLHAAKLPGSLRLPGEQRGLEAGTRCPSPVHLLNHHTKIHPQTLRQHPGQGRVVFQSLFHSVEVSARAV